MNAKPGIFLRLVPVCLVLIPASVSAGLAQGSIGPVERIQSFPGFRGAGVTTMIRAGGQAFFTVQGTYTPQTLWRSDGTGPGTFALGLTGALRFWSVQGSRVFYTRSTQAPDDPHRNLWRSDGSQAGTIVLTQGLSLAIDAPAGDPPISLPVPETGLVFFSAGAEAAQPDYELWATDGTPQGTRLVKDVNPEGPSNPSHMAALGGQLVFLADTPQGPELWRSDGTASGTFLMLRLLSSRIAGYAAAGPRFFLAAGNPDTGRRSGPRTAIPRAARLDCWTATASRPCRERWSLPSRRPRRLQGLPSRRAAGSSRRPSRASAFRRGSRPAARASSSAGRRARRRPSA